MTVNILYCPLCGFPVYHNACEQCLDHMDEDEWWAAVEDLID